MIHPSIVDKLHLSRSDAHTQAQAHIVNSQSFVNRKQKPKPGQRDYHICDKEHKITGIVFLVA